VQLPKQNSDEFLIAHTTEFEVSSRQPEQPANRIYVFGVNNEGQFIDVPDGAKG
jgi:hypothetical protein